MKHGMNKPGFTAWPVVLLAAFLLPVPGYAVTCALLGGVIQGASEQAQRGGPTGWVSGAYLLGHLLLSSPWLIAALLWSITRGWGGVAREARERCEKGTDAVRKLRLRRNRSGQ